MKISVTILLVALVSKGYSQLTCYQCLDCPDPIDNNLKATQCGLTETTTVAPTVPLTEPTETAIPSEPTSSSTPETPPTIAPIDTTTQPPGIPSEPSSSIPSETPPTTAPIITAAPPEATNNTIVYRCYTAQVQNNGTVRLNRGCVEYMQTNADTCKTINNNAYLCSLCNTNECNSATALVTSAILILSALLVISLRLS